MGWGMGLPEKGVRQPHPTSHPHNLHTLSFHPLFLSLLHCPTTPTEGSLVTVRSELRRGWTLQSIIWGDDTTTELNLNAAGPFSISKPYANQGNYSIMAVFMDSHMSMAAATANVTVADVAPTITHVMLSRNPTPVGAFPYVDVEWSDPGQDLHQVTLFATPADGGYTRRVTFNFLGSDRTVTFGTSQMGLGAGLYWLAVQVGGGVGCSLV